MTTEIHTARCMCGTITLEATGPARYAEYCHCKWCQQSAGSAFIIWVVFEEDNVRVTSGELNYFQSSQDSRRGFCKDCGSTMSFHSPGNFDIALGVMDRPERFPATKHIWSSRRISHVNIVDDLPRHDESDD